MSPPDWWSARLRTVLEGYEAGTLATRPASGDWSAIENVRHLILSAQLGLGPFVRGGLGLSPLPLPDDPAANATTSVAAVLEEWGRVHTEVDRRLDVSRPEVAAEVYRRGVRVLADQLPRALRHQQAHGRQALRALSQVTGQAVRLPRAPRNAGG